MKERRYTEEQFKEACRESLCFSDVAEKLGLSRKAGGNKRSLQRYAKALNVDTSHFLGQAIVRGRPNYKRQRYTLDEICVEGSTYTNMLVLKRRLIQEGYKTDACERCGISDWLGQPLVLHLHHKNEKHTDNRIDNLEVVCPNCHSQSHSRHGRVAQK